jgi:hypothetical protein
VTPGEKARTVRGRRNARAANTQGGKARNGTPPVRFAACRCQYSGRDHNLPLNEFTNTITFLLSVYLLFTKNFL